MLALVLAFACGVVAGVLGTFVWAWFDVTREEYDYRRRF